MTAFIVIAFLAGYVLVFLFVVALCKVSARAERGLELEDDPDYSARYVDRDVAKWMDPPSRKRAVR